MKLSEEQKETIKKSWGDWEAVHAKYDALLEIRLRDLDPEYLADLQEATKGATFWYA